MAKRKWSREEIEEYRKEHGAFYFNKEDSNILVPKMYGIGITLNWANPVTWMILLVLLILIVARLFFR